MDTVLDAIERRRSCRAFFKEPLSDEQVGVMLEAMRRAPSAGNRQAWHFYVVRNPRGKTALTEAAFGQSFITDAPVVFVICAVADKSATRYGERGRELYCLQDTAAAIENLLLAAEALDLGACWVGAFDEQAVLERLDLVPGHRPIALIPVGKPASEGRRTPREPLEAVVTYVD